MAKKKVSKVPEPKISSTSDSVLRMLLMTAVDNPCPETVNASVRIRLSGLRDLLHVAFRTGWNACLTEGNVKVK